jgi:glutathione S-transferase
MKLYDYILSGSCYKVRLLLGILDLDHETVPIDFYPGLEHKKPAFLELNPLGQLPVLEDGDLVLRDAQAIMMYLATKHDPGKTWFPEDPALRGQVAMWMSFGAGEIMSASAARLHDVLNYPFDIAQQRKAARAAFVILDDHLATQHIKGFDWLAGTHPTIADIACFPYVALSEDGGISRDEYPAIERWLRSVMDIKGFTDMPGILRHWAGGSEK